MLIALDINENGVFELDNTLSAEYNPDRFIMCIGSIRDNNRVNQIFSKYKPDIVFHAAAHKHVPMMEKNVCEAVKNNVFGTLNVIKAAMDNKVKRFVLISTDKAVNPTSVMGATKRIAELLVQYYNRLSETEMSAVRFGNVLGSNGSVIPTFQKQIAMGGPVTVTHKDIKRYFMTIPEAVQLVLQAGAFAHGGEIFVLDMGELIKIYDLACDMIRLSGYKPHTDIEIKFTGLRLGEKMFEEINLSNEEEVVKTSNNKIYKMKNETLTTLVLNDTLLESIKQAAIDGNTNKVVELIKKLVPSYVASKLGDKMQYAKDETLVLGGVHSGLIKSR